MEQKNQKKVIIQYVSTRKPS